MATSQTALVLAGTSFVGCHLCRHLQSLNIPLHATSRAPRPGYLTCDLTCPGDIDALLKTLRPRWVFQCAGATATSSETELSRLHEAGTQALLDAVRRHVPDAVTVLFGSAAEYGPVPPESLPIREDTPCRPHSAYGRSKLAQTRVAETMAREHGLRIHVVRPFNLLGPGLGPHFFAAALCERLRQAKAEGRSGAIPVHNGHATRDWLDVRDAVDAVVRLTGLDEFGVWNIASGRESAVLDLADFLCRLAGDFHAIDSGSADSRSAIDRSCGDATRVRTATGWQPRIGWETSLRQMWQII